MIVLDCEQGSSAWHKARLGIPTASKFDRIITPATRKPSTQAQGYIYELVSEWLIGVPHDAAASGFMDRGRKLEEWARKQYAFEHEVDVAKVGLVLRDDRLVAASPDALVGKEGLLEIKTPAAAQHVRNLVEGMGGYWCQVQGQLWLAERQWCDLMSYHPELPPAITRVERDGGFIASLVVEIEHFLERLLAAREKMIARGCQPAERLMMPATAVTEDPF